MSAKFDPSGHLSPGRSLPSGINHISSIPSITDNIALVIPPDLDNKDQNYSVSAIGVPVGDILFKLASNAGKSLVLNNAVKGNVTLNLIHQPLDQILKSISEQVGATYEVTDSSILIKPDLPYWQTYPVDYVNLKKESTDSLVLNMSIGNASGGDSGGASNSQSAIQMTSGNDFWTTLQRTLLSLSYQASNTGQQQASAGVARSTAAAGGGAGNASAAGGSSSGTDYSRVAINKDSGLVSVFALAKQHKLIQKYLNQMLSRSNKQVLIEVTVVEVELSDQYQAGVDWSAISGNTTANQNTTGNTFAQSTGQFNIKVGVPDFTNFSLTALQKFGDTKVLSSPRIMAISNQTSMLKVVDNEVYFTVSVTPGTPAAPGIPATAPLYETTVHTVPVGFMMTMTPFISDEGQVSINVRPSLSRIVRYVSDPNPGLGAVGSLIPVIQEREMSSVLRLRNKQTAIIGGLIQDSHNNQRSGIPGVSDLPGVGDLFAYRDDTVKKSELLIFIRPVIVTNPDINFGDLQNYKPFLNTKTTNTN